MNDEKAMRFMWRAFTLFSVFASMVLVFAAH